MDWPMEPALVAEARRWRRLKIFSRALVALVGGMPVLGFAAASALQAAAR